ncbi:MAG: FHA domain-containing protein [Deltaproteobacteria bacterium]|nr:FHA domain-containing protein [Deltaproteobacteria bacterium]
MVKSSRREKKVRERRGGTGVLLVTRPGIPPTPLTLTRARTIIGRDRDSCDVVLEDEGVSRQHASVSRESTGYFALHDLGSKNGIFVGGHRVDRRTLLHGDTFKIGDTTFTFQLIPDKTDKPTAPLPPPAAPPPAAGAPPPGAPPPPMAEPPRK